LAKQVEGNAKSRAERTKGEEDGVSLDDETEHVSSGAKRPLPYLVETVKPPPPFLRFFVNLLQPKQPTESHGAQGGLCWPFWPQADPSTEAEEGKRRKQPKISADRW
jgi:hypothetical protein